jgi:hypothetical protein
MDDEMIGVRVGGGDRPVMAAISELEQGVLVLRFVQ